MELDSFAWLMEEALRLGISYTEAFVLPYGELQDLVACNLIMAHGWKHKKRPAHFENDIP